MNYISWKDNMKKVQKFVQILYWSLKRKTYLNVLEKQFTKSNNSELCTDNKRTKYVSNPNDILNSTKKFYKKLYTKRQPPKLPLLNFLSTFLTETKCQINNFTFVRLRFL